MTREEIIGALGVLGLGGLALFGSCSSHVEEQDWTEVELVPASAASVADRVRSARSSSRSVGREAPPPKREVVERDRLRARLEARREARRDARAEKRAAARAAARSSTSSAPAPSGGPSAAQWAALRACESGGDYSIDTGNGYFGAYQFDLSTWASYGPAGNPAHASPAEQDRRARALYAARGSQPWPVCGRHLGG